MTDLFTLSAVAAAVARSQAREANFIATPVAEMAQFEYQPVTEDDCGGAAMDFVLDPGMAVTGMGRCCENCRLLVGRFGNEQLGMFAAAELKPLNDAGSAMLATVTP